MPKRRSKRTQKRTKTTKEQKAQKKVQKEDPLLISLPKDPTKERGINRARRALLLLGYLHGGLYGKDILALMLSRGSLSESMAAALSGLSVLNGRAIISALSRAGVIHAFGEKQLQMRHKRRYIELIYSVDSVATGRAFREMLSNVLQLLLSLRSALETDQLLYLCERDYALFTESEVERLDYRCPICGEPLTQVIVNLAALDEFINRIKESFKKIVF